MSPTTFTGKNNTYTMVQPLGLPGLYTQAYLCTDSSGTEVVIKMLQPNAPADGPQVLENEGDILIRVAAAENAANLHYAVRVLDAGGDSHGNLQFLVLERATGQNVQDDLVDKVVDWQREPLAEATVLAIANHFARALQAVHSAGYTYDDMRLQNLFWNAQSQILRIIDWNVVSELSSRDKAIAGDWARFGARLYELYTGEAISISREGLVVGSGPHGSRWEALPAGVQALIRRALDRGYEADAPLLHALDREVQLLALEQAGDWESLLTQAELAEGDASTILAPLSRAERILARSPHLADDSAISKRCSEARTNAEAFQGRALESMIREGFTLLEQRNWPLATEVLHKAYDRSTKRDPRPRRGLWLITLLKDSTDADANEDLRKAVEFLNAGQYTMAQNRMKTVDTIFNHKPVFQGLQIEVAMRREDFAGNLEAALTQSETHPLPKLRAEWPDLDHYCTDLQQRHATNEEQRRLAEADQQANAAYQQAMDAAHRAEIAEEFAGAIESYHAAIKALQQHSSPDTAKRRWIERHLQHLMVLRDIRRLGAECAQLEPAASPDVEASFTKRARTLLTPLAPIFTLFEQRGRRFAEEKFTQLEQFIATQNHQFERALHQIHHHILDVQNRHDGTLNELSHHLYHIGITIGRVQQHIEAGMLKRAEEEIDSLETKLQHTERLLRERQSEQVPWRADLEQIRQDITHRRTQAKTDLAKYRNALETKDWSTVADAFQSAIRAEADEVEHYKVLDQLFPVITSYLNDEVLDPSQNKVSVKRIHLYIQPNSPLIQMSRRLENCLGSIDEQELGVEFTSVQKQRLIDIQNFLAHINRYCEAIQNGQPIDCIIDVTRPVFNTLCPEDRDALPRFATLFAKN